MANEKRLIDANALIEKREEMWQDRCDHMVVRVTNIENAPTVDAVEVVHGRWEFEKNPYMRDVWLYRCTACDARYCDNPRYCPNCGAKMDGDGNVE